MTSISVGHAKVLLSLKSPEEQLLIAAGGHPPGAYRPGHGETGRDPLCEPGHRKAHALAAAMGRGMRRSRRNSSTCRTGSSSTWPPT